MRYLSEVEMSHVGGAGATKDTFENIGYCLGSTVGKIIGSAVPFLGVYLYQPLGVLGGKVLGGVGAIVGIIAESIFSNPK
jgi:hypothetical protein